MTTRLHTTPTTPTMIEGRNEYYNGRKMADGNLVIDQFFSSHSNNSNNTSDVDVDVDDAATRVLIKIKIRKKEARSVGGGMLSACLINLEETRRFAEWIPYRSTLLPLINQCSHCSSIPTSLRQGGSIKRTLQLLDLWKDNREISLWPH